MTEKKACVWNREIGTKSDCYVELELQNSGGIQL